MSDVRHDEQWMQVLSTYADDECSPDELALVGQHLRSCERCRGWLAAVKADRSAFIDALDSSARGLDISDRVMEEVAPMPKPEKPTDAVPLIGSPQPAATAVVRRGLRLVELLVIVAVIAVLTAILFPVFFKAREKARQTPCLSNVKQIALGMMMFAQDHEGRLPEAYRWKEQLAPYVNSVQIYACPSDPSDAGTSYAMNPRFSGADTKDFDNPAELIVIHEVDKLGHPDPRHNEGMNCGFMDGHAKWLPGVPDDISMTTGLTPPSQGYGLADKLKLAYTASAEIWVKSVHQAVLAAEKTFADRGGFVLMSSLQAVAEPYDAQVIGRVPSAEVAATINALGTLGWVANRQIRGDDLTRKYIDETRQVQTQRQRQERLTEVVEKSVRQEHVVEVEENLAGSEAVQGEAESKLYDVADRTTLATITATLSQRDRQAPPPPAISASWHGAIAALKGAGVALSRVGIWLGVFAWVWLPLLWLGLRHRRARCASRAGGA